MYCIITHRTVPYVQNSKGIGFSSLNPKEKKHIFKKNQLFYGMNYLLENNSKN